MNTPGGIRTPDLLIRSQLLYPAELRTHGGTGNRRNFCADRPIPIRTVKVQIYALNVLMSI